MSIDTINYDDIADGIADYAGEIGGDIQRYIVAPAMLSMIGPVDGKKVLDLYCGAGYLSRRLALAGANVTAVDSSERLIGIAREINYRENENIKYAIAEPTDLSVIDDSTYDDIVCNMGLMMTRDLTGTIAELARLVKMGGRFIFSIVHPCFCMPDACWAKDEDGRIIYKTVDNYHGENWWPSDIVGTARTNSRSMHRTMSRYVNALSARGFTVRRMAEPRPSADVLIRKPQLEIFDRLPAVMVIESVFPYC